jgi:hypothetical protein
MLRRKTVGAISDLVFDAAIPRRVKDFFVRVARDPAGNVNPT